MTPISAEPNTTTSPKANLKALSQVAASDFTRHINQSTSPNKEWVVAVGTRDGKKPKWEKIPHEHENGNTITSYLLDGENIGNYLVNIKTNRVVAALDGGHFGTLNQYNHESASYTWSPNSQWLVEHQDWKWHTDTCSAHYLNPKGKWWQSRVNLLTHAESIVDTWLKKNAPQLSAEVRSSYVIRAEVKTITNDGTVTMKISAEIPKAEESEYVDLTVSGKIAAKADGNLTFSATSIKSAEG
ncbi:MAG: hypothetical protein AB8F34_09605 [Akkermansiaceae bacterium]